MSDFHDGMHSKIQIFLVHAITKWATEGGDGTNKE
jgi:hypothetical protein